MSVIKLIGKFITEQLLEMKWLEDLIRKLVELVFGSDFSQTTWGKTIHFFIYDFIKISFLLCVLIFTISYIQSYFPPERTKKILSKVKGIKGNISGALLGTVTPFCSCSSIPIFIGFTRAGLTSGITFSFLISSPLVDLGALVVLIGIFGLPIAIAYVVVGLILAVIGGLIIEKTGVGNEVEDFVKNGQSFEVEIPELSKKERYEYAKGQMIATYRKVVLYIVIGIGIGSLIRYRVPEAIIQGILGSNNPFSVLIASVIGAPIYADIFGTIPIAEELFDKGVGIGTILAFLMSVTTLSIPSIVLLKKAVKPKLLLSFIAIVLAGIILIGYLFNALNFLFI